MLKKFYSRLFKRYVEQNNKNYWRLVYAELLYRIDYLEERKCNCFRCNTELQSYKEYLKKLKKEIIK